MLDRWNIFYKCGKTNWHKSQDTDKSNFLAGGKAQKGLGRASSLKSFFLFNYKITLIETHIRIFICHLFNYHLILVQIHHVRGKYVI